MNDRVRRCAIQNAETSRLLGVPYVPMYRTGLDVSEITPARSPEPQDGTTSNIQTASPPPAQPGPLLIEVKAAGASAQSTPPPETDAPPGVLKLPAWLPTCDAATAASRTREQARAALDALRSRYEADAPHRHFKTDHHNIVWGEGDPRAPLMFIGEAPGEEEDKAGRPFVGRSGQLLDKMIIAMGLSREKVYIANTLKTRPPDNATPTLRETHLCAPYLFEQIAIVGPKAIVTLGLPATRLILSTEATMGSLRGRWAGFTLPDGRRIPVMPTYHPAYVLRSYTDEVRGKVWSDLQLAMKKLAE
ncbi:MAG: uracil-DNA glycosylase [Phycisphaerae bacterium]|nr:uracil-DNA glycosylase [Phycisphaerae bacterium]